MSALLAAILPAAAGLVGSVIGAGSQHKSNKSNIELAKYQFDRDVEMWNMQNEYNTPLQQMSRLREAKLNPNLVYGTGAVGNVTSAPPKFNAPTLKPYTGFSEDLSRSVMNAFNAQNLYEQNKNIQKQNEVLDSTAELNKTRAQAQNIENKVKGDTQETEIDIRNQELQKMRNEVEKGKKEIEKLDTDIVLNEVEKDLRESRIALNVKEMARLQLIIRTLLSDLPARVKENEMYLKYGISKSDGLLWRAIGGIARLLGIDIESAGEVVLPKNSATDPIMKDLFE